jgi:hypothetical protein
MMPKVVWVSYSWCSGERGGTGLSAFDVDSGDGHELLEPRVHNMAHLVHIFKKDISERHGIDYDTITVCPTGLWVGKRAFVKRDIPGVVAKIGVPLIGIVLLSLWIAFTPWSTRDRDFINLITNQARSVVTQVIR